MVTYPLALFAGLVAFASPCFLPIVPAFVGQLVGKDPQGGQVRRRVALANAGLFVAGFTAVFVILWSSLALVGRSLGQQGAILRIVGGAVLIVMGLHVAGLINIGLINRQASLPLGKLTTAPAGYGRSVLLGVAFGAGWTPCIGPVLGGILGLASVSGTVIHGISLMLVFCLGLGLPLVLVALGANVVTTKLAWFQRHHVAVSLVSGALLIGTGFLMVTNLLAKMAQIMPIFGV